MTLHTALHTAFWNFSRKLLFCSRLFSCAMSSRSAGAEGMGSALTMGTDV